MMTNTEIKQFAKAIRKEVLESAYSTNKVGIHFGSALSLVDYLAVLYGGIMHLNPKNPQADDRDRFVLSKGHAYAALYSTLCLRGFFSREEFRANYMTDGGLYPAHPIKQLDKGIECSSGSLGMGISYAVGKALNARKKGLSYTTYVAMGDGECNEGSAMEALMSAAQFGLDNLVVFIDHNGYQQDGTTEAIMNAPLAEMTRGFGCNVVELDGNDVDAILEVLHNRPKNGKPFVIVGHTKKGKGVSFMEGENSWHHATITEDQYKQAIEELS